MWAWLKRVRRGLSVKARPRDTALERSRHDLNDVTAAQAVLNERIRRFADEMEALRHD